MPSLTRHLLARASRPAGTLLAVLALVSIASCMGPVPRHDGPPSDHFDGRRFFHDPPVNKGFFTFLRWQFSREPEGAWEADLAPPAVPAVHWSRRGPPDLAILPIGAYLPRWFMATQHISPGEAILAADVLGAGVSMAMHHACFQLADEGQWQAQEKFEALLLDREDREEAFWAPAHGESRRWE